MADGGLQLSAVCFLRRHRCRPLPTQEAPAHNCKKYVEATRALILGLFGFLNRAAYRLFKQEKNSQVHDRFL